MLGCKFCVCVCMYVYFIILWIDVVLRKPPRTYDARSELAPVRHGAPQEVPRAWQGAQKTVDMSENSVRSPINTSDLEPRSHLRRRLPKEQLTDGKAGTHRRPRQRVAVGRAAVHTPDFPVALQAQQPVAGGAGAPPLYALPFLEATTDNSYEMRKPIITGKTTWGASPPSSPPGYDCGRRTTTSHTGTVGRHYPPCFWQLLKIAKAVNPPVSKKIMQKFSCLMNSWLKSVRHIPAFWSWNGEPYFLQWESWWQLLLKSRSQKKVVYIYNVWRKQDIYIYINEKRFHFFNFNENMSSLLILTSCRQSLVISDNTQLVCYRCSNFSPELIEASKICTPFSCKISKKRFYTLYVFSPFLPAFWSWNGEPKTFNFM